MLLPGNKSTLLLGRAEVAALLTPDECREAVRRALILHATGHAAPPAVMSVHAEGGGFHVKAALVDLGRPYFAAKINANFPDNPVRRGLPTIQGVVVLCDGNDGSPLALLDSMEITSLRTAATTAAAVQALASAEACVLTLVGCGAQGAAHLRALVRVLRLERVWVHDLDPARARRFAQEMTGELGLAVEATAELADATRRSQVCVTCTPSRTPILSRGDVAPGTLVAAVGADNPAKQEIAPDLLAASVVVVDSLEQCATIGDLHHALAAGVMKREDVRAELGEVLAGIRPGRRAPDEVVVFDSSGVALGDVAAAAAAYEKALRTGAGLAWTPAA